MTPTFPLQKKPIRLKQKIHTITKGLFLFLSIAVTGIQAAGTEEALILTTLSNFKFGWEGKNLQILSSCFNPIPPLQAQAYEELFKITENIKVDFAVKGIKVSRDMASVDTDLSQSYNLVSPNGERFPKSVTKRMAYILKKTGDRWFIASSMDFSKINTSFKVTPQNIPALNQLLSNMTPDARAQLANEGYQRVATGKGRVYWTTDPLAKVYVVSLADKDLTKTPSANLLWKVENVKENFTFIPDSTLSSMVASKIYFLHVFSYDDKGTALKGQIMQVVKAQ